MDGEVEVESFIIRREGGIASSWFFVGAEKDEEESQQEEDNRLPLSSPIIYLISSNSNSEREKGKTI